ncbi:MAG: glycoside hydrolase family 172 protein [Bacillota bacterium]|nr:DUF2961 domain-containing protein [Bacillota bacterium]NLU55023.1 DUF2961 domain-containing protein [Bacillota bacterium]HOA91212.1 DUF2961 domain-containing protein [Bacillota bacterium]HOL14180.1 DUF2961 domain-containing protein [Bacillota bacterium]HPQ11016.1 DUF2961 domain-containing protein [Bacillota bacterium]
MQNLFRPSHMVSRSICAENPTGGKGMGGRAVEGTGAHAARDLGVGWKVNPYLILQPNEETVLADIKGPGIIEQIWATPMGPWRNLILRIYWDDQEHPSVECPFGDFFGLGWGKFRQISSLPVCVNPGSAFNSYWPMPFKKRCRVTITSLNEHPHNFYYQINYALGEIPEDSLYFHAQFRRTNPLPYKSVYTIVDGIKGRGQYVGTSMSWGSNNSGWWGEGEIKFYLDGDKDFPTICGTGTEDYFCGSYNFENQETKQYQEYSTPYAGFFVLKPDGLYQSQTRFNMYRWHITDPVRFEKDLRVTIQALGWRSGGRYLPLQDDLASVAYWYQELPTAPFPKLPDKDMLEII